MKNLVTIIHEYETLKREQRRKSSCSYMITLTYLPHFDTFHPTSSPSHFATNFEVNAPSYITCICNWRFAAFKKAKTHPSKADATPTHQQDDVPQPWVWEARKTFPVFQWRRGVCCST